MRRIIIIVLALAVVLGIAFFLFGPKFGSKEDKNKPITLTIYGLWEDETLLKPALDAYKKLHPNITIKYVFQSSVNYQKRVQTQILNNEGPDIFMLHNSWVPVYLRSQSLSAMPDSVMGMDEYSKTFYPVAKDTLTKAGKIYAIPRGIDGLALYYNEDLLKNVQINVPKTWIEFTNAAIALTTKDQKGNITTAGAAIGSTGNIDHWPDILGLLFVQQPGANLEKPNNNAGVEILRFYTNFITKPNQKVWDVNLGSDTQMFEAGKLAFYFAPSWRAFEIHTVNKDLHFKTAPVPQLPGHQAVSWASFWAYGVSAKSANQAQAWEFLKYFTSADTQKLLYGQAAKVRLFGLPYSATALQKEIINDPLSGAFVVQGPSDKSWYLASKTQDEGGLDSEMIKYYENAVNATLQGADPKSALETAAKGVQQVLDTFVNPPTPVPSKK